ncbi:MAG: MarR family transcriptional regulator [Methermicoccaceae archaeon]
MQKEEFVRAEGEDEASKRERIAQLSPSAKLVYKVLEYSGFLTQKEIAKETYLPQRTVRYALDRLKGEGMLIEKFYFKDARQSLYGLKNAQH